MHASREIYRQILATPPTAFNRKITTANFPRSRTFRWIKDHPWISISCDTVLIWLATKRFTDTGHIKRKTKIKNAFSQTLNAVIAIGTLILKNPSKLQIIGRLSGTILQWVRK